MNSMNEPIAIIGSGCRFPGGASSPSKLWKLLEKPRDVLSKIDRFRAENWYNENGNHHGASNVLDAYLLSEDPRVFDAQFFSIAAGEADSIDPQQRVLLETVYEGLESAGLTLESLQNSSTAVYVGVMCDDYSDVIYGDSEAIPKYAATGSARSILSNRVSYFFNWHGPSMTIDTACSSSLVAVHQAVQVLRSGQSRLAVAAGSNLIFGPKMFIAESNLSMLSPTGRSQMWDANANGYARGEGVASVVLKKLSDAIADGDRIDCIIRETGINQDGRTPGITMPSADAQAALIRQTYARAGLDLGKRDDRPQYFEAHGTGTKAGDPKEAGAIYKAFFAETGVTDPTDILHVGSIKTVVGHTEGTAGIAGLLKASLAIQNMTIPPNMLFNNLNPDIAPFYDHLKVPTTAQQWPELPPGVPRRVSVNSFGFGGANAHAIVESYEPHETAAELSDKAVIPFTFSATSEKSLYAQLKAHLEFLNDNNDVDLKAIAWTLSKRSAFQFRTCFSASSKEALCDKLEAVIDAKQTKNTPIGTRPVTKGEGIIGIFTGQGAQWAAMARNLILASSFARGIVSYLEQSLSELPEQDRPLWSLREEMLAQGANSRISEGLLSQPLCTAVQIVLVDLLHKAGVKFKAVVGHSSGEIGCAYAAGFISARNAIRIAYYRGLYAKLAMGPNGEKGAMLAAGTSMEDADELCHLPSLEGRVQVAASNSSASVTLSGDADAVAEIKEILEDENKFARQLKVDTAYHSHHMIPCGGIYIQALEACNIEIMSPKENAPSWYSSVFGGRKIGEDLFGPLRSTYWRDNMLNPVLFSQALTEALGDNGLPSIALEVGPHPALKGPATTTIEEAIGSDVPYSGILSRGKNDVEAIADALGFLWTHLGPSTVDFASYASLSNDNGHNMPVLMRDLPSYTWDHDRIHWYETRTSRSQRLRSDAPHQLLGTRTSDECEGELRWRNYIKPSEMQWLSGHAIQGQILFPAAGFAVMAVEAARAITPVAGISMIEIENFSIHRAMSFPDEAAGVETLFTISNIVRESQGGESFILATFGCDASTGKDSTSFTSVAHGKLIIRLGEPSAATLPEYCAPSWAMTNTDVDHFYASLAAVGYNYNDLFRGIKQLSRTMDLSSGVIHAKSDPMAQSQLTLHPAVLDVAFQAIFAAMGAPGDGGLWTLLIPTRIDKIRINPSMIPRGAGLGTNLPFSATLAPKTRYNFGGDVDIYDESCRHAIVQVEGLHVSPLSAPQSVDDHRMFAETTYGLAEPCAHTIMKQLSTTYGFADSKTKLNGLIAGLTKQIAYRYPFMDILEIGAGIGNVTQAILNEIDHSYASYTYTHDTPEILEEAREILSQYNPGIVSRTLEVGSDLGEQDYKECSYGLIVSSIPTTQTATMEDCFANMRKLLKPGGYLILYTADNTHYLWDELFHKTGFSGVDTEIAEAEFSVMVTQAVDTQMKLIKDPLLALEGKAIVENLLIVGGAQLSTFKLVNKLTSILQPFCSSISVLEHLQDLDPVALTPKHTVLCLSELDEPIFKPFTQEKYKAVQSLTEQTRNILWVVQGSRGDNPYANIMPAIGRCFYAERKDLLFRFIDTGLDTLPEPQLLAKTILQAQISEGWKNIAKPYNPQWSLEREIFVVDAAIHIPRYMSVPSLDAKYNSVRRPISTLVSLDTTAVAIESVDRMYELTQRKLPAMGTDNGCTTDRVIHVIKSSLLPVHINGLGSLHIVIGRDRETNRKVLALTDSHCSHITVPQHCMTACDVPHERENDLLITIADQLVALSIMNLVPRGSTMLVHEPTPNMARALARQAAITDVKLTLTSATQTALPFHYIHPFAANRTIRASLPQNPTSYINLSVETSRTSIGIRIDELLPARCERKSIGTVLGKVAFSQAPADYSGVSKLLGSLSALSLAHLDLDNSTEGVAQTSLADVSTLSIEENEQRVINWSAAATVPVKVCSAEHEVLFRSDRTYFLVGSTGELGLSLCRWMVSRGARYVALASRNPNVDPQWLRTLQADGAVVKTYALDITSRASLMTVYNSICEELPPIAGVANAAMVLVDDLFARMPFDTFNKVIRPKIDGTILLDELFPNNDLDFFILFSSLTYVTGNIGQTPYAAGNSFMVSMAESRRKRGLAGSVMNLAGIFGIGLLNRQDKSVHERLINMGYANISEKDFHQFFAEAVMASHPNSGRNYEVSTGLKSFDPTKDSNLPEWIDIPKFARFNVIKSSASGGVTSQTSLSIRAQLLDQTSEDGVHEAILGALLSVLYRQLNIPPEENCITPESSLVELGLDSLVAVDMRSWFSSELEIDIPVLKLLGGATVGLLVEEAVNTISRELIPNVKIEDASGSSDMPENEGPCPREGEDSSIDSSQSDASASASGSSPPTSCGSDVDYTELVCPERPKMEFEKTERMSYGSSHFWFLTQYLDDPRAFNIQFRLSLHGVVDVPRLERAVEALGERHEALRTAFFADPEKFNEPTQGVLTTSPLILEKRMIADINETDEVSQSVLKHHFDIEHGEVARTILLSLNSTTHFLVLGFHHIALDGFSFNVFLADLNALYEGQRLPQIQYQFSDFAARQRREVENGAMMKELKFWRQSFETLPEPIPLLPMAKVASRQTLTRYEYEEGEEVTLDAKTSVLIKDLCRRHKSTKYHFFLAVLKVFLFRFVDVDDICIGLADANRTDSKTAKTIGYLLNLLPLRFKSQPQQTFGEAIKEAREKSYAALAHSRLPFDLLIEDLKVPRSSAHSPLFQVLMDYRLINARIPLLGAQSDGISTPGQTAYDITLDISDIGGTEFRINFRNQKSLYSRSGTQIMLDSYIQLVKSFALASDAQLNEIDLARVPLYDPNVIQQANELSRGIMVVFPPLHTLTESGHTVGIDSPATLTSRIHKAVRAAPTDLAVKDGDGVTYSYEEMAWRAEAIAHALENMGVCAGDRVAIYQDPTADWVCSCLAIWRLGAAFVPLDPRNPVERLNATIHDCIPRAILCRNPTVEDTTGLDLSATELLDVSTIPHTAVDTFIEDRAMPSSLAAVLYTSGSTGVPKGVMLCHAAILNQVMAHTSRHGFGKERVLQQSAYSFDLALWEVLVGLLHGGSVYVVPKEKRLDPEEITKLIASENLTATQGTPSEYFSWIRQGAKHLANASSWKLATAAGEAFNSSLKDAFRSLNKKDLRVFNHYGPTESSLGCSTLEVEYLDDKSTAPVPIGSPLPNYAMYVVDRNLETVPVGVTGEILIGGIGAAMGYLNNQEKTNSLFVPDKMTPAGYYPYGNSKVYRSGDLGRMHSDGSITYHGRIAGDTQIKLHGVRTELTDIESAVLAASGGTLVEAVAALRNDSGVLICHVQFSSSYPTKDRSSFLKGLMFRLPLPKSMCPALLVEIDAFPLSNHGKIDRRAVAALPLPQESQQSSGSEEELTETEVMLEKAWLQAVSNDIAHTVSVTPDSDFFHVGGDSLVLVTLQAIIRERFDVVLPMIELFEASTLRAMASKIDNAKRSEAIDWDAETSLEANLVSTSPGASKTSRKPTKTTGLVVLLTGATGYLGKHFLRQLVEDENVQTVHCVAVRPSPSGDTRALPVQSSKIVAHTGDLSEPCLGLSQDTFHALAEEVDIVLHSGANRSFWDYYQVLRGPNLTSTKELIRLASARRIPLHYISSAGTIQGDDRQARSMAVFEPPTDGTMGYLASKWASEVYLEKAALELDLPVHIHRVTSAPADAIPSQELLQEVSRISDLIEALPNPENFSGSFDLIHTESLARTICKAALSNDWNAGDTFHHHESEVRLSISDLTAYLPERNETDCASITPFEWAGKAKRAGLAYHFASQDLGFRSESGAAQSLKR